MAQIPRDGGVITLRSARRKWILVGLACLGFTAIAVALLPSEPDRLDAVGLAFGAAFFGLGALISAWQLVPGAAYLRIGPDGLVVKSLWRTHRHGWDEFERFEIYEVTSQYSTQRMVGFQLRDGAPAGRPFGRTLSRGLAGVDGGLPDTYGRDPDELAELLQACLDRYGR